MHQPVDPRTFDAATEVLAKAASIGANPLELLNQYSLLLTPNRVSMIRVGTLTELRVAMERWAPHEFVRRVTRSAAPTAEDMHRAMMSYLTEYIEHIKTLEE